MITIITPCSRPENLKRIAKSICNQAFLSNWNICYDLSKVNEFGFTQHADIIAGINGGVAGKLQINKALSEITHDRSLIYVLDDDNLLHPDFYKLKYKALNVYDIITFDQELEDGTIRKGNDPRVGYIDQAQFLIRRSIHEDYEQDYNADGMLISKLIAKYPDRWLYIPETLSYYNRLKWKR